MAKILVADDQRAVRASVGEILKMSSHDVFLAEDGQQALDMIIEASKANVPFDMLITDVVMPNMGGDQLIGQLSKLGIVMRILVISANGTIGLAVDCMKKGAMDFMEKPFDLNTILHKVTTLLKSSLDPTLTVNKRKRPVNTKIIGSSVPIVKVKEMIAKIAPSGARVLITGPNGTGKELVARSIHQMSGRSSGPFVEVNCAAIPSEMIESELFGHEKGSFTSAVRQHKGKFEQACGGTIFLDEIGDMSLSAQAKVLRVLQESKISRVGSEKEQKIDVRVICATNKNLKHQIERGSFREDLYHRISVICVEVPSLSERSDDIPLLVNHFLDIYASDSKNRKTITPEAVTLLQSMNWTGNIRQLGNIVERLTILCDQDSPIDEALVREYVY